MDLTFLWELVFQIFVEVHPFQQHNMVPHTLNSEGRKSKLEITTEVYSMYNGDIKKTTYCIIYKLKYISLMHFAKSTMKSKYIYFTI